MSILVTNVSSSTSKQEVSKFFSFCGTVDRVEQYTLSEPTKETSAYHVFFANDTAVATALLLSGSELGGNTITVQEFNDGKVPTSKDQSGATAPGTGGIAASAQKSVEPATGASHSHDIEQESKPKSAILAEYLANGYVISDSVLEKAAAYDKQHGVSDKFQNFLSGLDAKYHLQDKTQDLDTKYQISNNFAKYYEKAKDTTLGSKLHSFYTATAKDVAGIQTEARRLADLKQAQAASTAALPTPESSTAQAAANVPITK